MSDTFETALPVTVAKARDLPHSVEAEESILACCALDGTAIISQCQAAGLRADSFYNPKHGTIYDVMLDLVAAQKPVEVYVIAEEMKARGLLDGIGGFGFLTQVTSRVPTTAEAPYYIERVRSLWLLRQVIRQAVALVETCHNFTGSIEADLAPKIEQLAQVIQPSVAPRTWVQAVDEAEALTRERMKPLNERDTSAHELSWGISDFDKFFHPIEAGELVIIGGYTSSGKSSLLRQIMWSVARAGHPALLSTIEVRDSEEAINLAGHMSGIRSRQRLNELHPKDQEALLSTFPAMKCPHFAVTDQDHSLASLVARARSFKRKHGLRALGVDYLQIMQDVKANRMERHDLALASITSELKRFATKEACAVFLLSGFNRSYAKDGNREPILTDLDGSASIEKDASRVILLDVPKEYAVGGVKYTQNVTADSSDAPNFFVRVIQAKGRNQGTSSIGLIFNRATKTFRQITR